MKTEYKENWDFYFTEVEDSPASVFVDLGLNRIKPVAKNPELLTFFLEMQNPQENGFSSKQEAETLFAIEDKITPALKNNGAIFAGRMTYDGSRLLYYYLMDKKNAEKTIDKIMNEFDDYEYSIEIEKDPKWEKYSDYLYPQGYELHTIMNRHIVEGLIEKGDSGEKPREVRHYIYFNDEENRQSFIDETVNMGYTVNSKNKHSDENGYPFSVVISREDPVTYNDVTDYTSVLYDIAEDNEGQYDGWETMMLIEKN